jgi:hypothetical protein
MAQPNEPVTLSIGQIKELHQRLVTMRHDVNNNLSIVTAAAELIRRRPENTGQMLESIDQQPPKIVDAISQFSRDLEAALRITKP